MDAGIIVDLETTGLNPEKDKIIEIGILEFSVDSENNLNIVNNYGAVEDPGIEITPVIEKLTGLNNQVVKDRQIDWALVQQYFNRASIVIAHNMPFDRGFLRKRQELDLSNTHWGCSAKHIDWSKHGHKTKALNYLAADMGFVNPFAHRAIYDCATTFRVIQPHLKELVTRSYEKELQVFATGAPFEKKDLLKERGYRWNPTDRVWGKNIFESNIEEERKFLADEIYDGHPRHSEVEVTD